MALILINSHHIPTVTWLCEIILANQEYKNMCSPLTNFLPGVEARANSQLVLEDGCEKLYIFTHRRIDIVQGWHLADLMI